MQQSRRLAYTAIELHPIGLGAMPLSLENRPDEASAMEVIQRFIEAGGNFIDTANAYCIDDTDIGHNERLIAKTLNNLNNIDHVIVATKGGLRRPKGDWTVDASPDWLRQSCEKSLRDLDVDTIFLYQLHAPDPAIPITESVGELTRLKGEGKILHIGLSNVTVDQLKLALSVSDIISVQNKCHLFKRDSFKNGVIEFCEEHNITFLAHSPVGGHFQHTQFNENTALRAVAKKHNVSSYQVMLAWLLHKSESIIPIPGATKISSIESSLAAESIELDDEDIEQLDKLAT